MTRVSEAESFKKSWANAFFMNCSVPQPQFQTWCFSFRDGGAWGARQANMWLYENKPGISYAIYSHTDISTSLTKRQEVDFDMNYQIEILFQELQMWYSILSSFTSTVHWCLNIWQVMALQQQLIFRVRAGSSGGRYSAVVDIEISRDTVSTEAVLPFKYLAELGYVLIAVYNVSKHNIHMICLRLSSVVC